MTMPNWDKKLIAHRVAWLERAHEEAKTRAAFENGMRAGLQKALMAIVDGTDTLGESIDPPRIKK